MADLIILYLVLFLILIILSNFDNYYLRNYDMIITSQIAQPLCRIIVSKNYFFLPMIEKTYFCTLYNHNKM